MRIQAVLEVLTVLKEVVTAAVELVALVTVPAVVELRVAVVAKQLKIRSILVFCVN